MMKINHLLGSAIASNVGLSLLIALTVNTSFAADTEWSGFFEEAVYVRDEVGLSKARTTAQFEGFKFIDNVGMFSNVSINSTFRVTYDAVYELNDDEYGDDAGGSIILEGGQTGDRAHGDGFVNNISFAGPFPNNAFADPTTLAITNPNSGLMVLGENLHPIGGGVAFGVPVRPCDVDSRGCIDDYMDADGDELASPEIFGDRADWIRELYVDGTVALSGGKELNIRLGKQQVVWGRTDLFRVLDVINPVDYSRNNIYDELEDIRIPMWILQTEYRMGANEVLDDSNISMVWNFDKFRPHNLGQCGTPNVILDAGCFFRGMKNLWDNGGTVANFAGVPGLDGLQTTDFGPGQIGIRGAELPEWKLSNTQLGFKYEGVYKDLSFSINAMSYRSQLPSLRGSNFESVNAFTGDSQVYDHIIAFDIVFPRVKMLGGSFDYYSQDMDTVFRVEAAYSDGEEFANTLEPRLFSESDVVRYVLGADKNVFIRSINKNRAFLLSGQLFGQHLLDHELESGPLGKVGMADWEDNWIATFLIKGWWMNDRLSPQILMAHDFRAGSSVIAPSIDWLIDDNWQLVVVANVKVGDGAQEFDDCRSCNPWGPFTATPAHTDPFQSGSVGLGGYEPLGRFRAGPIGMANKEDEIQITLRYRF
jgi:hypothetical protein